MSTNAEYRVLPHEPDYQPVSIDSYEKANTKGLGGGLGCLVWGVIFLAFYILIGFVGAAVVGSNSVVPFAGIAAIIIASVGVAALTITIKRSKLERIEREKNEQAREAELHRVTSEATSLTSRLARIYETSAKLAIELPARLADASDWLRDAEGEYQANAYGPFWDAVENAALHLSDFNSKAKQLSKNAAEYYQDLSGRKHNFPAFPVQPGSIPDASAIVNDLRHIVRMGQTNFQFANIWEHRRTREVLIAGFHTLGEAINNLGSVLDDSIYGLRQSVSSDIATSVEEQIRTRESLDQRLLEQNRMLDNIQHHRIPDATDTPRKS